MRSDRQALADLTDTVEAVTATATMSAAARTALIEALGAARVHQAHVEAWGQGVTPARVRVPHHSTRIGRPALRMVRAFPRNVDVVGSGATGSSHHFAV